MGEKVLNIKFNEDKSVLICCLESGLRIYNVEPLRELRRIENDVLGSLALCANLYRANLKFIVAGGTKPKFLRNAVAVYDDAERKVIAEIQYNEEVKGVTLNTDKLFVVTKNSIRVHTNTTLVFLFRIETRDNPRGLLEVTPYIDSSERQLMIFPGRKLGSIQIIDLANTEAGTSSSPVTINAHQGDLACIALNMQGTRVATASVKGTLIRVWDTTRKILLVELRRGSDVATVYCINFSPDSEYICCSSDKGTVHIFALKNTHLNRRSALSGVGILGTYGESQWALTNFTVPPESACICAFGPNHSVIAACLDGTFHKYVFNNEGVCNRQAFDVYLDLCDDEEF